jgi:hypothetical protein
VLEDGTIFEDGLIGCVKIDLGDRKYGLSQFLEDDDLVYYLLEVIGGKEDSRIIAFLRDEVTVTDDSTLQA